MIEFQLPPIEQVLKGTLPPVGAALLLCSVGGARLLPLAAGVGLYVTFGLLRDEWPQLPHALWHEPDGRQWLLWGVVTACLWALLERCKALPAELAAGLGVATAAGGVYLLLQKQLPRFSTGDTLLHVGGGGLAVAALVLACRHSIGRGPQGIGPAIVFTVLLSVDAGLLTIGRSGLLGQLCGAVAAALGAAASTGLWRKPFGLLAADGIWLGVAHGLFLLAGAHLASLPWEAVGSAMVAPFGLLLLQPAATARPFWWTFGGLLLVAGPLAGAFWFARDLLG